MKKIVGATPCGCPIPLVLLVADEKLSEQAKNNSIDNFKFGFEDKFLNKLIERMDSNQDIFTKIMDDKSFGDVVKEWMLLKVYNRLNVYNRNNG